MDLENNCQLLQYLQDHGVELFIFVQLFSTCQYSRGLSCSWRSIEEQMRQSVFTDELPNCGRKIILYRNFKNILVIYRILEIMDAKVPYKQSIQLLEYIFKSSEAIQFCVKIKLKLNMDATEFSFWVNNSQRLSCILLLQYKSQFVNNNNNTERVQFIIQ